MDLRPYQLEAITAIEREWAAGRKRTLLVLPTGAGKTFCFCRLAENVVRQGGRALILAHRGELLDQAADKLRRATGLGCSVEKAEQSSLNEWYPITVGSVQTLMREKRLKQFAPNHFDCVIVDEAHHALADGFQRVLDHFSPANVLGVTATPDRGDLRNLGNYFDSMAYEYSLPRAIRDKYLCPIKALTIPIRLDLMGVHQTAGDFNAAEVGHALDPYLEQIADVMAERCADRKSLVFLPLIATSQKFCMMLQARGVRAAEVNGESRDRAEVLKDFDAGEYQVLCNSMLLTEGYDCPSVDCVVCLRPTKMRSLYCQVIGRGTRIHPGKDHLLLLDFLWLTSKHELARPAHLLSPDAEVAERMTKIMADAAGVPMDIEQVERDAETSCMEEREARLARELAAMRKKKEKLVDPLQFAMSIHDEHLANYAPAFGWETQLPKPEQLAFLEKAGVSSQGVETAGYAQALVDAVGTRRAEGLATPKQIRFLERMGFKEVGTWEFESARKLIDRCAMSSWRVPPGIVPGKYQPNRKVETVLSA